MAVPDALGQTVCEVIESGRQCALEIACLPRMRAPLLRVRREVVAVVAVEGSRVECVAEQASRDTLEVTIPRALDEAQARRELRVYLATWKARHPGVAADVIR